MSVSKIVKLYYTGWEREKREKGVEDTNDEEEVTGRNYFFSDFGYLYLFEI